METGLKFFISALFIESKSRIHFFGEWHASLSAVLFHIPQMVHISGRQESADVAGPVCRPQDAPHRKGRLGLSRIMM